MAEIFVSYARSTVVEARLIADSLRAQGYEIWIDDQVPANRSFADVIDERLRLADAVVVIWSADAVDSQWVRSEANRAREDAKLVQVRLDRSRLPMPFDQIHCADLSAWSGDSDNQQWRAVLNGVALILGAHGAAEAGIEARVIPRTEVRPPGERPTLAMPTKPSIAILPFKNNSGDADKEYLADAITEDIVTALSRWRWFFVVARHSSFTYRGSDLDPTRVGAELGVRYILRGAIAAVGQRVRVNAQLVDAVTGANVWVGRYDRPLVDVLALQDEITEHIASAIEPAMLDGEGVRLARKSLADFSALDCFYRGMWSLNKLTEEADTQALALFREAIRLDPSLSVAHAGAARILYARALYDTSPSRVDDLRESLAEARVAIDLDPREATGYYAASGAAVYLSQHAGALDYAEHTLALNPNFAYAHYRLGQILIFSGRPEQAIAPIERCLSLSPFDPQLRLLVDTLALAHYQARNYSAAADCARSAGRMMGGAVSAVLVASLARLGKIEDAVEALDRVDRTKASRQRPFPAPYADPASLEHIREGYRLARRARGDDIV